MQSDATLLATTPNIVNVTCGVRLHTLLYVAACCGAKFGQQLPPFLWSVIANQRSATMCGCHARTLHMVSLKIIHVCHNTVAWILLIYKYCGITHCSSQHCWELLNSFALSNNSQHFLANNVGNCCVRMHDASDMDWHQQQHAQRTKKAGRPNASCEMYTYLLGVIVSKV